MTFIVDTQIARQTILIVDDAPENIDILHGILGHDYAIKIALNGAKALELATRPGTKPDLILLDVMMPGMDGYEVCRQLKASPLTQNIPVIFISALGKVGDETRGFDAGAVDYISKPISPPIVRARVRSQLALYDQSRVLEELVRVRTRELYLTQDVTILSLASLVALRDSETGGHILRSQQFMKLLAEKLSGYPRFHDALSRDAIEMLYKSTPLHDIGKVAVPDAILRKPGPLSADEFNEMKRHTIYGRNAILQAERALGKPENSFLHMARTIAYSHHEKWDGSGYPEGLAGDAIPVAGRLMALVDAYDAITSKRVYKEAIAHEDAVRVIRDESGRHFDPDVVDAFLALQDKFYQVSQDLNDANQALLHALNNAAPIL